jgi:ATP-dependent Clp protease, protease subunit
MKLKWNLSKDEAEGELLVYDTIGTMFGYDGVGPKDIADALKKMKNAKVVNVRINSPGGNVYDGMAIYSLLNQAKQKIVEKVDGLAASAASVIAMAGDDIEMAAGSQMMIHRAMMGVMGYSDDLRKEADLLDKTSSQIAEVYANRTGQPVAKVLDMMQAETWMTPEEACQLGFANSVVEAKRMAACFDLLKWNYKHPPKLAAIIPNTAVRDAYKAKIAALKGHKPLLAG